LARDSFLYLQLYDDLKKKIEEGIYIEGDKIPSDDELKDLFNVSMITVKKALTMLKDEGLLQRIPGVGTFVKERNPVMKKEEKQQSRTPVKKIGLVLEHVSSSFGLDLLYKIDRKAEENGYKTIIRFSYYSREKETEEIRFLMDEDISGLIVMPCHGLYYNPKILKLILEGFPVVVIDKKLDGISVPSVRTDNKHAIKALVKDLWDQGCNSLGFISSEIVGTSSLQERKNGFYEAVSEFSVKTMSECTLTFDENIYEHPPKEENIETVVKYLEKHKGKIDGIICAEYSLLPAIMEACRRTNINDSIKISCVDGLEGLSKTYMKQDEIEMADKIMKILFAQIDGINMETDFMVPAIFKRGNDIKF
jgi:DNA-binding LacI/PurR family transcriptional regulator